MPSRIYNVRMNIDELRADLAQLDGDAEQAAWLRGYNAGVGGAPPRWEPTSPAGMGYARGAAALAQAQAQQARQAEGGQASVASRKAATGSAQPQPRPEQDPEGTSEGTSNSGPKSPRTGARSDHRTAARTAAEPIHKPVNQEDTTSTTSSPPGEDYPDTTDPDPQDHVDEIRQATDRYRVQAAKPAAIRAALRGTDLRALVRAFGGRDGYPDWEIACHGLTLHAVAAILGWAAQGGEALRAPSGFLRARERWEDMAPRERSATGKAVLARYGVELPKTTKESA